MDDAKAKKDTATSELDTAKVDLDAALAAFRNASPVMLADFNFVQTNWYDQCPGTTYEAGDFDILDTSWSTVFAYNARIYMILLVWTALMLLCILIPGMHPTIVAIPLCCVTC